MWQVAVEEEQPVMPQVGRVCSASLAAKKGMPRSFKVAISCSVSPLVEETVRWPNVPGATRLEAHKLEAEW